MSDIQKRPTGFGSTSASAPAARATPEKASSVDTADLTSRFNALRTRRDQINAIRVRREVELDNAKKAEKQCAEEAKSLGVSSPEELEALIAQKAKEASEALDKFEKDLDDQETLLRSIDERVAQADAR